ncbi:MAG TPA: DUF1289 domain-containing protein [Bauldia sp.]|nr:DUF1289 domain-containing protein [Bauldia sp.]
MRLCTLDAASGLCLGCGRTLAEIGGWLTLSAEERAAVMRTLPDRLAALAGPAPEARRA